MAAPRKKLSKVKKIAEKVHQRRKNFLNRRPHRSFKKTLRRDYQRDFTLPGYWSFTNTVRGMVMANKWLLVKFVVLYGILSWLVIGIMSQQSFALLSDTLHNLGDNALNGQVSDFSINLAIFSGVLGGAFNGQLSEAQQVYGGLLFLLGWLTLIWLLRQIMAGSRSLRLRDGVYASAAPLVPTFLIFLVLLVQLIPFIIAIVAYATADSLNILGNSFFTVVFWLVEILLAVASLYWLSSSFIALVIVTLPGMYPLKALKTSSDLVIGRRLRILFRLAWLAFSLAVAWLVFLLPAILIANLIHADWLPLVPVVVLLLGSISVVWSATYIYLLYRKLVDDGAAPA